MAPGTWGSGSGSGSSANSGSTTGLNMFDTHVYVNGEWRLRSDPSVAGGLNWLIDAIYRAIGIHYDNDGNRYRWEYTNSGYYEGDADGEGYFWHGGIQSTMGKVYLSNASSSSRSNIWGSVSNGINIGLDYSILFPVDMLQAAYDFYKNYFNMRHAKNPGSDKYFHAKANFQATHHGPGGKFFAIHFSNLREMWDMRTGDTYEMSLHDQVANAYGREQAKYFKSDEFREALKLYRTHDLPYKY